MSNLKGKRLSFFSDITTIFRCAALAYGISSIFSIWCSGLSSPENFSKVLALGIVIYYALLSFGMKCIKMDENGVEFFYYLRPFARRYRYHYGDVRRVYHEPCYVAGAFPFFIITTNRNHPFLFLKKKYLFFANKDECQAKSIITNLKGKGIKIVLKGSKEIKEYLDSEDCPIDLSEAKDFATESIMKQNNTVKSTIKKLIEKGLDARNANIVLDEVMPPDLRKKERVKESNKIMFSGIAVSVVGSILFFSSFILGSNSNMTFLFSTLLFWGIYLVIRGVLIRLSKV